MTGRGGGGRTGVRCSRRRAGSSRPAVCLVTQAQGYSGRCGRTGRAAAERGRERELRVWVCVWVGGGRAVCVCGCLALVFRLGCAGFGWLAGWLAGEPWKGQGETGWLAGWVWHRVCHELTRVLELRVHRAFCPPALALPIRPWIIQHPPRHASRSRAPSLGRAERGPRAPTCLFVRSLLPLGKTHTAGFSLTTLEVPVKVKVCRSSSTRQCAHSHARGSQLTPNAPASDEIGSIRAGPFLPLVESTGRVGWVRGTYVHMVVIYPGMLPENKADGCARTGIDLTRSENEPRVQSLWFVYVFTLSRRLTVLTISLGPRETGVARELVTFDIETTCIRRAKWLPNVKSRGPPIPTHLIAAAPPGPEPSSEATLKPSSDRVSACLLDPADRQPSTDSSTPATTV